MAMGGMHVTIWWNDNDSGFILDKQLKWTFRKTTVRMLTCLSTRMHHPDPQQTSICSYSLLNVACLAQRHPELIAPFPKRKISGTPRAFPQVKNIQNSRLSPSEKACFSLGERREEFRMANRSTDTTFI
jgi:hypothetical protein